MKIVFLSNFFNHHQAPISEELWEQTRGEYFFVETEGMPQERIDLGYRREEKPYLLRLAEERRRVLRLIREADVVIAGSAPEWLVQSRIKTGKLLFRYAERPLRKGSEPLKVIPRWIRWHWRNPKDMPVYLLCASAYTAGDYGKFGLFRKKSYKWGYFPALREQNVPKLFSEKNTKEILWVGRFLELKHPEQALQAARKLKQERYDFCMHFIGTGVQEPSLKKMVKEWDLNDRVRFGGARSPEQVRSAMEKAGIFLFTSDRQEGWGAVVNEAMNSGCAIVASHAAGAVPFLLENGENGMIYESGNVEQMCENLRYLLEKPEEQQRLGAVAYERIRECWNPNAAAQRLIRLSEVLLSGESAAECFREGPCSKAEEMDERWFL